MRVEVAEAQIAASEVWWWASSFVLLGVLAAALWWLGMRARQPVRDQFGKIIAAGRMSRTYRQGKWFPVAGIVFGALGVVVLFGGVAVAGDRERDVERKNVEALKSAYALQVEDRSVDFFGSEQKFIPSEGSFILLKNALVEDEFFDVVRISREGNLLSVWVPESNGASQFVEVKPVD